MSRQPTHNAPWVVGRYILHGEIASGGMATVHFGRLQGAAGFSRSVAIKRLHAQFAKDPDFVAMFVDEARLAARIAHPNVVPTLDVISQDGELLLVMDYVRGAALSRLLRSLSQRGERVPLPIAAAVLAGVLHGLHAAHEARSETGAPLDIVHRDVSPQNVLVGADGVARLLDFGVAKAAGRWQSTREGQLKGKTAYMAPEQISGGVVSRRTDVYAASIVLWETLTGKRLFRSDNEGNLLKMVLSGEAPPPSTVASGIPPEYDAIVLRGLDRDPDRRFATAREMAAELEAVGDIAPPSEIGDWVERVAAGELRERALRIEEMERGPPAASSAETGPERATARPGARAKAPSVPGPGDSTSQGSHLAMVQAGAPKRRALAVPRWSLALAVSLALLVTVAATYMVFPSSREPQGHRAIASATSSATPTAAADPDPSASPTPGPAAPEPLAPAPIPLPDPPVPAVDPSVANRAAPTPSPRPRKATPPPRAAPVSPAPPARPDCSPPYTADEKGHLHFKPSCI